MDFLTIEITFKKVAESTLDYSTIEITSKKVRGNNLDFFTIEKVRGNNVDFSTIKITSKKARGNDEDFSISKPTLKQYVETTWKFVKILIEPTLIQRVMPIESLSIGYAEIMFGQFTKETQSFP